MILLTIQINFNMDTYISNDYNNPINWDGTNAKCEECNTVLDFDDFEEICCECFEKMQEGDAENLTE